MNPITLTENEIIAVCDAALNGKVRGMESLPGRMSLSVLKKIAARAPAVYVAYLGGNKSGPAVRDTATHRAVFAIYIVTDRTDGRRGSGRKIGAYDIINTLVPALNDHSVPEVGTLESKAVENLFSVELDRSGVSIYAATFQIPMTFDYQLDETALDNFITYHAEHSMTPGDDEPAAIDSVQLTQI